MDAMGGMGGMSMPGLYGTYPMERDASGTSWQPDSTPMAGQHAMNGPWMTMWHGSANLIYDDQGGPRGATKTFSNSMLMFMGRRELPDGALGARVMLSADPLMGSNGYPLLFQTGETADGVHPLIDRQHPHNLLMEAAASYTRTLSPERSAFVYAGVAGEQALGPPAFMHRLSGLDNPVAPLGHHWLDSTHVTYGVVTSGYVWRRLKLEASAFNGREPDQNRYRVELRALDSWSARVSFNPTADLAFQASDGRLASPEQLEPTVAVRRFTSSASYNRVRPGVQWQTTVAFGRNERDTGPPEQRLAARVRPDRRRSAHRIRARGAGDQGRAVPARRDRLRQGVHDRHRLARLHPRFRPARRCAGGIGRLGHGLPLPRHAAGDLRHRSGVRDRIFSRSALSGRGRDRDPIPGTTGGRPFGCRPHDVRGR